MVGLAFFHLILDQGQFFFKSVDSKLPNIFLTYHGNQNGCNLELC